MCNLIKKYEIKRKKQEDRLKKFINKSSNKKLKFYMVFWLVFGVALWVLLCVLWGLSGWNGI